MMAPLCNDSATIAGNIEGPHNCSRTYARMYSGVERTTTKIMCPVLRPNLPKNRLEMSGKNTSVRMPLPTRAICVSSRVAPMPGNACSVKMVANQSPNADSAEKSNASAFLSGVGTMSSVKKDLPRASTRRI